MRRRPRACEPRAPGIPPAPHPAPLAQPSLPGRGPGRLGPVRSLAAGDAPIPDTPALVDAYAERIADTPAARKALETIFASAAADSAPSELPPEVEEAYRVLDREAGLGSGGPAGAPGCD